MKPITHTLPLKTPAAAGALGETYHRLIGLIRFGKIHPRPQRDSSGDYLWFPDDMERARELLANRRLALAPPTLQTSNAN
jgi:hypothetical protein